MTDPGNKRFTRFLNSLIRIYILINFTLYHLFSYFLCHNVGSDKELNRDLYGSVSVSLRNNARSLRLQRKRLALSYSTLQAGAPDPTTFVYLFPHIPDIFRIFH